MTDKKPDFNAELLAPCGMNCAICGAYLAYSHDLPPGSHKMTRCAGCRPRGKKCAYIKGNCAKLSSGSLTYCYECADFPCPHLAHLDARYRRDYAYSMVDTLRAVQRDGLAVVLELQKERYKCARCGGVVSVHNGKCYNCDEVKSWRG